jgi:hypothetical protein
MMEPIVNKQVYIRSANIEQFGGRSFDGLTKYHCYEINSSLKEKALERRDQTTKTPLIGRVSVKWLFDREEDDIVIIENNPTEL